MIFLPTTPRNLEVAWVFEEIGDLLEIKGDNPFKIRAYRQAARALGNLPEDVGSYVEAAKLETIPGIGKALAKKVQEIVATGQCTYLERLKKEVPPGLREMFAIPGLGPKSIQTIYKHLGITTLEALEEATKAEKIRKLPGLGNKTEARILEGIELLRSNAGQIPLAVALTFADEVEANLKSLASVVAASVTGAARRGVEMVKKIEILAATLAPQEIFSLFCKYPPLKDVHKQEEDLFVAVTPLGVPLEIRTCLPEAFSCLLHLTTGSQAHLERLAQRAREKGLFWPFSRASSEAKIYQSLGLPWIPPELREDEGEIEAALEGQLPELVAPEDIRGEFHVHSTWSDGVSTLRELVLAAREQGYHYLGIADHSPSLAVANGLSAAKLAQKHAEIKEINAEFPDFYLFHGAEVDILSDGTLDYPPEVLSELDFVIAAVHTGFQQDEARMTARVEAALQNPYVDIFAHPTGRVLGKRPPYALSLDHVLAQAAETGKMLEINAAGDRLDLSAGAARRAKAMGVLIVINTDAHEAHGLADVRYGVTTARRGWLTKKDIFNTREREEIQAWVAARQKQKKMLSSG